MTRDVLPVWEWVAARFPLDGPHTPQRANDAGQAVAELTRYLAHATYPGRGVRCVPDAWMVLGGLAQSVDSLGQVCAQLSDRLQELAQDPALRTDAPAPAGAAAELAVDAAGHADQAAATAAGLARSLHEAQAASSRLYHQDTEPGGGAR